MGPGAFRNGSGRRNYPCGRNPRTDEDGDDDVVVAGDGDGARAAALLSGGWAASWRASRDG